MHLALLHKRLPIVRRLSSVSYTHLDVYKRQPLTIADRKAHETICRFLADTPCPLLSEEGKHLPFSERRSWETLWIGDPWDGTKEFIKRNGEFTVNIALVHHSVPVMGVIYVPVKKELYFGVHDSGA